MSNSPSTSRRQRGEALIEALIGMLLTCIVGLGLAYSTSRVSVSQKDMNLQSLAVAQLRDLLQANGSGTLDLCTGSHQIQMPNGKTLSVTVSGCDNLTATVGKASDNATRTLTGLRGPLSLSVSDKSLGGEVSVGGVL